MPTSEEHRFVYEFREGDRTKKDLLGGKGANLAEMTNLGLPVPPGFTVTTEACRAYLAHGDEPPGLRAEIDDHLRRLEAARASGSARPRTRCWSRSAPVRSSPCPG
ncbi:hypothetical protein GCM10029992_46390 [Glycomyces albus]